MNCARGSPGSDSSCSPDGGIIYRIARPRPTSIKYLALVLQISRVGPRPHRLTLSAGRTDPRILHAFSLETSPAMSELRQFLEER